ncbi:hypothetical protein PC129_g6626 [Phytophthora cactorum]|uniref:Uncharacterized protein n=1 Tax=Phytophthora cactorum TaxID=29920 RepID=A0A8T1ICW5_9STRA|nr:hypothetical protein Pcac1_g741 [Phytophthora cactorum]KAG3071713.1 hypothetical protein PC121_g9152 [Phytophthora cactorum]KAG3222660.1 hypothetical protein PC129_g6626 [Phytophthora cactorum]
MLPREPLDMMLVGTRTPAQLTSLLPLVSNTVPPTFADDPR